MVQQVVGLSSQLHTGKVPIQKFPAGEITPAQWIATELQLKAAMTSQGCKEAWNTAPCVADDTAEAAAANSRGDDNKQKIARTVQRGDCIVDRIILTKQIANCGHQTLSHHRMAKRKTMGHLR